MKIEQNRILTIQGRSTAIFVGVIPYALLAITYFISPGYICPFLNDRTARIILLASIVWELIGVCILWNLAALKPGQTKKDTWIICLKMIPIIIVFIMPLILWLLLGPAVSGSSILPPLLEPREGRMGSIIK